MTTIDFKKQWANCTESGHRAVTTEFYRRKALEHALIMGETASMPSVDLGCGAGELLSEFAKHANVREAIDFSDAMLEQAKRLLVGSEIKFINRDVFDYLETCKLPNWVACESLNQYFDPSGQLHLIDAFVRNSSARNLYLFDTICSIRYDLWHGTRTLSFTQPGRVSYLRGLAAFTFGFFKAAFSPAMLESASLGTMGYSFNPGFFIRAAKSRNLQVTVVNSLYYEYRYHVVMNKHE